MWAGAGPAPGCRSFNDDRQPCTFLLLEARGGSDGGTIASMPTHACGEAGPLPLPTPPPPSRPSRGAAPLTPGWRVKTDVISPNVSVRPMPSMTSISPAGMRPSHQAYSHGRWKPLNAASSTHSGKRRVAAAHSSTMRFSRGPSTRGGRAAAAPCCPPSPPDDEGDADAADARQRRAARRAGWLQRV